MDERALMGAGTGRSRKPRALYFRWPLTGEFNPVRWVQEEEALDRLTPHFEVVICEEDGDYAALLDRHRPDLAIFESKAVAARKPVITGARDNKSVPKAMLVRSDAMCHSRLGLLADVDQLGIDACFAIDWLYAFYLSELKERLFYMPHSVNPRIFRNFGLPKSELIAFYGHFLPSRPWKIEAARVLKAAYPCTFHPHDTTRTNADSTRMVYGEAYARELSRARFAPVEGGFHNMVTRKFLEVPGVGSALVAPRFEMLEQFGFVDMHNCVLGEPGELPDKLDLLMADPGRYAALVAAGSRLVRSRHLHANRTQIRDWYEAFVAAPPGSVIRQTAVFGDFVAVPQDQAERHPALTPTTRPIDHFLLARAEAAVAARDLERAEADLVACMNLIYARYFMEPRFYLAIVRLLQGRASEALFFLTSNYVNRGARKGLETLDPREAALLVVAYLAMDEGEKADEICALHGGRGHPELTLAAGLCGRTTPPRARSTSLFNLMPLHEPATWIAFVADVARAHGRTRLGVAGAQAPAAEEGVS